MLLLSDLGNEENNCNEKIKPIPKQAFSYTYDLLSNGL